MQDTTLLPSAAEVRIRVATMQVEVNTCLARRAHAAADVHTRFAKELGGAVEGMPCLRAAIRDACDLYADARAALNTTLDQLETTGRFYR